MATKGQTAITGVLITALGAGCAYTPNTVRNMERDPVTQLSARYKLEELNSEGKAYHVVAKGDFKVGDKEYRQVPFLMRSEDVREIIDDKGKTLNVEGDDHYALVPVNFDDNGRMYVVPQDDKAKETVEFANLKLKPRKVKVGFRVSTRRNLDDKFNFDNINIGDEVFYSFRCKLPVYDSDKEQDKLPLGLVRKQGSTRILNRQKGHMELNGELYVPMKATRVKLDPNPTPETNDATGGQTETK
jgi:hypothetical protein